MPKHAKTSRKYKRRAQPYEPPVRRGPIAPALLYGDEEEEHIALEGEPERERAVIYLGRIPYGFFENEMHGFFSQFGEILNLRLARNKKTGRSKHYAFIEFEEPVVADVVAESMNNYLLFGHILKCKRLRQDQIHPRLFRGGNKIHSRAFALARHRAEHNKPIGQERYQKIVERRLKNDAKKKKKLKEMGIDYDFPGTEYMAMPKPSHTEFVYSDEEDEEDEDEAEVIEEFTGGEVLDFGSDDEDDEEDYEESDDEDDDDEEEDDDDEEENGGEIDWSDISDQADGEEEEGASEEEEDADDFEVPWSKPVAKAAVSVPSTPKASSAAKKAAAKKASASARKPSKASTPAPARPKRPASAPRDMGFRVKRNKAYKGQGDPTPVGKRRQ